MLQKIKEYAISLLTFQLLLTIGIGFYLQNKLDKSIQQKEDFVELFSSYHQSYIDQNRTEADYILNILEYSMKYEDGGGKRLDCGRSINNYTKNILHDVDVALLLKEEQETKLNSNKILTDYQSFVLENLSEIDEEINTEFINGIYQYPLKWNETILSQTTQGEKDIEESYWKNLKGFRELLVIINTELLEYILYHIEDSKKSLLTYTPHIKGDSHILEGDTLKLDIELVKRFRTPLSIIVENNTFITNENGFLIYKLPTPNIGNHEINGNFSYQGGYGQIIKNPFSHQYTVSSKCNQ